MTRLHLALVALLVSLVVGCGASSAQSNNTNTPRAGTSATVELGELHLTLPNGIVIGADAAGAITVDGAAFGTLHADGRITAPDGTTLSALIADGQISFRGELVPLRIEGDRLTGVGGGEAAVAVAAPDRLQNRDERGELIAEVPIVGLTDGNHATVLYLVAAVAIDRLGVPSAEPAPEPAAIAEDDGEPVLRVPVEGAPQRGPSDALVTIVAFSDFQCPFCSRVVPTLERVLDAYGHDVRLVFRNLPLPFHANAMPAAEAAAEAFAQRGAPGFWQMHDLLFENQQSLEAADLERYAQQIGLDLPRFRLAMQNHTHQAAIQADMDLANRVGANGTPSFFVNGRPFVGAQPFEEFQRAIDAARTDAQRRVAGGVPRGQLYDRILAEARAELPPPPPPPPRAPEPEDDPNRRWAIGDGASSPVRGPRTAPVTIQVFSDFQCPFCSRAVPTMEQVLQTYGTRVRLVFRHYPLPFHPWAQEAAELSIEIRAQRGDAAFWQFHDLVFENQRAVSEAATSREGLLALARQIRGVDIRRATRALDQHTHAAAVQADQDAIRSAGASIGTPSFFVNGRLVQGAQPFEAFQRVIDQELAAPAP